MSSVLNFGDMTMGEVLLANPFLVPPLLVIASSDTVSRMMTHLPAYFLSGYQL